MARSSHQTIAPWFFGILFSAFLIAAFWLSDEQIAPWLRPIPALFASLLAGLFGFFITGSIAAEAKWSGVTKLKIQACGGAAFFVIVLLLWSHLALGPSTDSIHCCEQAQKLKPEIEWYRAMTGDQVEIIKLLVEAEQKRRLADIPPRAVVELQ